MIRLTHCNLKRHKNTLLRPAVLFQLLLLLGLATGLALAHVHLRFVTRDLQIETSKLHKERNELNNKQARLIAEVEQLKDFENLRWYAEQELGMELCPTERSFKAVLTADAVMRWRSVAVDITETEQDPMFGQTVLASLSERMVSWSSVSQADDN